MNETTPPAAAPAATGSAPVVHAGADHGSAAHTSGSGFWMLTLGSIGVVYGDIGTSPLYALREAVQAAAGKGPVTQGIVLGVLSLIVWSLILVVTIKYVLVLLRADNNGEGGTLSLTALAFRVLGRRAPLVLLIGVIGASMFYGSALITPALSVLSAVEGLEIAAPGLDHYVLPVSIAILVALFAVQSRGTARVSVLFGPVMLVWFVVIAVLGGLHVADNLHVFAAVNPYYALAFLAEHKMIGLVTTGFVMLAVTGGEALYTDLGHFGRKPIQTAWLYFVFPALLLNYFGQGALILNDPAAVANPFYRLVPGWALFPMVVLATIATVIASQAVITGAFSITRQAIQLGLLPRVEIRHTSAVNQGQIYIPRVNTVLLIGVVLLVLVFKTSSALASAYGLAVATAMAVDGLLLAVVIWKLWRWSWWATAILIVPFALIDATFLVANLMNFFKGAWAPVLFGVVMVVVVVTWRRGTRILADKTRRLEMPLDSLVKSLQRRPPHLVPGTAVFLTSDPAYAPTALLHSLKHYKVLHEHNVILTIKTEETPRVRDDERVEMTQVSPLFARVALKFGFMETPNVPKALVIARRQGWQFDIMSTSFFVSRRSLKPAAHSFMPRWQDRLFIAISKTTSDATDFFHIPTGRVVEVGTQVTI